MAANAGGARKRVAIVYHFFPHYRAAVNCELLYHAQHDYLFVGDVTDPTKAGIKEWTTPEPSRFLRIPCKFFKGRYCFQGGLIKLALRRDIDALIYLGDAQFFTTWISAALARLLGKRVLFWSHGWTRREGGMKDFIRCTYYRLAHGMLFYGRYAKQLALEKGFKPENLYVVYNSLDYEAQKEERERITHADLAQTRAGLFPADPRRPMLICVSRMLKMRKLDMLLEAVRLLKAQGKEINVLLVGEGPERPRLETMAAQNGLSVNFYGACYDEAVLSRLIMAANAMVAPGKIGLTAMHALAYGTPVITQNAPDDQGPEWEAVIPGKNGGVFTPDDSEDLARVIDEWTEYEFTPEEIQRQCHWVVERFYNAAYMREVCDRAVNGEPAEMEDATLAELIEREMPAKTLASSAV